LTNFISMLLLSHLSVYKVAKLAAYHLGSMLEGKFKALHLIKCCQHVARGKFEASKCIKHCHCLTGKGTEWPAPRERRPEKGSRPNREEWGPKKCQYLNLQSKSAGRLRKPFFTGHAE
jgi:hypothetical protein